MKNEFVFHNFRVSFLGEDIVRIERKYQNAFCDANTFFIPDRAQLAKNVRKFSANGNALCFGEYSLYLPDGDTLAGLRLEKNGETVYRYAPLHNSGELPPPDCTPEVFPLADSPRILVPEGGYSAERKGEYLVQEDAEDVYLLFAEKDPLKLRRLYVELTGRCELVRLSTLGGWNSKYYAYRQEEAEELILDYERYGVPLDVMVIDTDWRQAENGWGYDINKKLFPDMKGFLEFAHSHNVEVMFNDHPEPADGAQVFDSREIAYRERNLQSFLAMGLDIWWYDRNWRTHLISPVKNVQWETFGMYLYHGITENFYRKQAGNNKAYRRPVIMGNAVEITNGDYNGVTDSASHRYAIQWTGDNASTSGALAQEVENLVRCSENCLPYVHSDCGGHTGNPDKEQFIRWMQFGTLSPVFRPHCTNSVRRFREPWQYDEETLQIVREYNLLRYRLLPYLYANAYEAYQTGLAAFRSLALVYPEDPHARRTDEYLLGNNLLIAPVCGVVPDLLGKECYTAPVSVTFYDGTECKGKPIASAVWDKIFMSLRHVSPAEGVPVYNFSAKLSTKFKLDKLMRLYIKNDDGATVYLDGKCVLEDKNMHSATLTALADLAPNEEHRLEIEYFQAGGEAFLGMYMAEIKDENEKEIYLPAGKWMDVFDGTLYTGGRHLKKRYDLHAMPLFVRLGALVPLAEQAKNTKEQSWKRLVYDFYPDRESSDCGYLYEDDGETTAYRTGALQKSDYSAKYVKEENAFLLRLGAAHGSFAGERAVKTREVTVKYHLLMGAEQVVRVCVNGKDVPFERNAKAGIYPFGFGKTAPDHEVLTAQFIMDTKKDHEVKFYLA